VWRIFMISFDPRSRVSAEKDAEKDFLHPFGRVFDYRGEMEIAATELRSALQKFVARRVAREDIDDVLQDIFVRVQQGIARVEDTERVTAWIYQIARNTIADHYRARARAFDDVGDAAPASDDDLAATTELATVLADFMTLLPPLHREALELTELGGLTQVDAAQRLGLSVPGMKSRVQRARAELRDLLESCCEIELDVRCRVVAYEARTPPAALPGCCAKKP
jgi:RNA polymerase sigma-70 factor (ECF subfamily)